MATYAENQPEGDAVSSEDIQDMMVQKAHELFIVCDKESKGFITKRDMQRLQTELPLSPDQLEAVFDSLDDDGNGFLTLEEFTGGFGKWLLFFYKYIGQCHVYIVFFFFVNFLFQ